MPCRLAPKCSSAFTAALLQIYCFTALLQCLVVCHKVGAEVQQRLYCCFTATLLLLYCSAFILLLYCCFTAALLRLYCCFTTSLLLLYCSAFILLLYCCLLLRYCSFTAALLLLYCCFTAVPCRVPSGRRRGAAAPRTRVFSSVCGRIYSSIRTHA